MNFTGEQWMAEVRPEVTQRLKALELIALWEGRLVTNRLCGWYGISRQQASADIKQYLSDINPGSIVYNATLRGYEPAACFKPVLTSGHINDYLLLLASQGNEPMAQVMESHPHLASLQLPDRAVQPEVVRELLLACRNSHSLSIGYVSMSQPKEHEREIAPHTLVYTGFRWHVRAWCHQRESFRDFVLSRIIGKPRLSERIAPSADTDIAWQRSIEFQLIANLNLSSGQRAVIARDFGMQDGSLHLSCREALAHYTLQRYPAAVGAEQEARSREFPLQVLPSDQARLAPLLFNVEAS